MFNVRTDGAGQRNGIDRHIGLANGRTITVDEKVRSRDWPDFALEFWSDHTRKQRGWVAKDLACDYLAYAFVPSARCYLLPFPQLRSAWRQHHRKWVNEYRDAERHYADNQENGRRWQTWFVPVPINVVLRAISDATLIRWESDPVRPLPVPHWEERT
jgi:hypothetical protein